MQIVPIELARRDSPTPSEKKAELIAGAQQVTSSGVVLASYERAGAIPSGRA